MTIKVQSTSIKEEPINTEVESVEESAPVQDEAETAEESDASENAQDEEESSEEQEEATEGEEVKEDDKPKKKSGFKKRIDKLNRRISEKEREAEYWREIAMKANPQEKVEEKPVQKNGKPSADDFETAEAYYEALADWKAEEKLKQYEAKQKETQVKSEHQKLVESYQQKVESFRDDHDDFDDVMESVDDVPLSMALQQLILESKNGPELAYELAKNREELERIAKLSPIAAAREFGKFEAGLKAHKPKLTTKTPAPIKPVGSKGSVVAKSIYDPNLSQSEYEALRAKQLARKSG